MNEGLRPLGESLDALLRRLGVGRPDILGRVMAEWVDLAGEPWSTRAQPVALHHSELVLEVQDGAAASLLRYRVGELLRRLDDRLGEQAIASIRIRVRGA